MSGVDRFLSDALAPWRKPLARHDPAKVVLDVAVSLALGGDACRDAALLRAEPGVYGPVASDATISRTIAALAGDVTKVEKAVADARAAARAHVWNLAGHHAPNHEVTAVNPLVIDLDATLVTAHSDKEHAAPTFKRGFGFHPLCAFVDHGPDGTGEPLAMLLRPGNAGSNTAADHEAVIKQALAAVPGISPSRPGKKVLIRTDGAGGTRELLWFCHRRGVSYSIGWTLPAVMPELYRLIPKGGWTAAYNADGRVREGADVGRVHRRPRSDVPNPIPRRANSRHRPHRRLGRRWYDDARTRPGPVPALQPRQASPRLGRRGRRLPRPHAHGEHDDADGDATGGACPTGPADLPTPTPPGRARRRPGSLGRRLTQCGRKQAAVSHPRSDPPARAERASTAGRLWAGRGVDGQG